VTFVTKPATKLLPLLEDAAKKAGLELRVHEFEDFHGKPVNYSPHPEILLSPSKPNVILQHGVVQSRAEQSRAEQSRAEHSMA
jgi:hypothetical protein